MNLLLLFRTMITWLLRGRDGKSRGGIQKKMSKLCPKVIYLLISYQHNFIWFSTLQIVTIRREWRLMPCLSWSMVCKTRTKGQKLNLLSRILRKCKHFTRMTVALINWPGTCLEWVLDWSIMMSWFLHFVVLPDGKESFEGQCCSAEKIFSQHFTGWWERWRHPKGKTHQVLHPQQSVLSCFLYIYQIT